MSKDSLNDKPIEAITHLENVGGVTKRGLISEDLVRAENEDKTTPYLVMLIAGASIAGMLYGYDTGIVGSAVPLIGEDLGHKLSNSEQEIITAGCTIGAIFGSLILGTWSDKIGRKWSMAISDVCAILGAVVISTSKSVGQVVAGRIILGLGVGGASVIAPLYIAELAPTAVRGRCVGINAFCIPFGQTIASVIGAAFGDKVKHGWKILFAIGVAPAAIQLCIMHWLPESPRVQITWGRRDEAIRTLRQIYSSATEEILALKLRIIEDNIRETTRLQHDLTFAQRSKKLWTFKPYRRAIITITAIQAAGQLTGFNTLLYYSGNIFSLLGFKNSAAAGLIVSGGNTFMLFIGMCIVDRVGRRRILICAYPGMILGLLWAAISFHFLTRGTGDRLISGVVYDKVIAGTLLGAIVLFVCSFGISLAHLCWYQSEFLPLEIRAAGSAVSTTGQWLANLFVSVTYLSLMNAITPSGVYGLFGALCCVGYTFSWFCFPETKGLSIDETEMLFKDGYGVQKSIDMRREKKEYGKQLEEEANAVTV
ncbi:putative myo-inositol transporter [Meredithblackwellia eburnea MCA 4105]